MLEPRLLEGYELVRRSLDHRERRELGRPRHWHGLTGVDRGLLAVWVSDRMSEVAELYTDVPCGVVPCLDGAVGDPFLREQVRANHPLRIDAVAYWRGAWWVMECKPDAGHLALGQVLTYGVYAGFADEKLNGARLAVITDEAAPFAGPVYDRYGVELFEVAPAAWAE